MIVPAVPLQDLRPFDQVAMAHCGTLWLRCHDTAASLLTPAHACAAPLQDLRPFDQALQVAMAAIIHLELFVTIYAVSSALHPTSVINTAQGAHTCACMRHA
jgi:hypothetical protein